MATSKSSPAKPAAKKTPVAAAVAEYIASLRDVETNAKHDDPRQSIARLAGLIADNAEGK